MWEKPSAHQERTGPRNWRTMRAWTVLKTLQGKVLVELKATWKVKGALCRMKLKGTNVDPRGIRPVSRVIKQAEPLRKGSKRRRPVSLTTLTSQAMRKAEGLALMMASLGWIKTRNQLLGSSAPLPTPVKPSLAVRLRSHTCVLTVGILFPMPQA